MCAQCYLAPTTSLLYLPSPSFSLDVIYLPGFTSLLHRLNVLNNAVRVITKMI